MANVREREKIAREIEKTSESIRKKHRALKTGRIEEGIALDILNLLSSRCNFSSTAPACALQKESRATTASKRERKEEEEQEKEGEEANEMFERSTTLHKSNDRSHDHVQPITFTPRAKIIPMIELLENVFGTTKNSLSTKFKISCKRRKMRYELAWARWGKRSIIKQQGIQVHVIAPMMSITPKKQKKKSGKGLPHAMTLNDNAIDYKHWDEPNELVDRLQLLDASHRALPTTRGCRSSRNFAKLKSEKQREKISPERCRFIEELHASARRNFPRRRIIVRGYDDLWQADVVEMRPYSGFNRGHHYILTVDVLSKCAWAVPLKSKGGSDTANAIARLLDTVYSAIKIAGPAKFKVGDSVRVSKYKTIFEKSYMPNWTTVFTIVKVQRTNPVTYLLEDILRIYRGKSIAGAFNMIQKLSVKMRNGSQKIHHKQKEYEKFHQKSRQCSSHSLIAKVLFTKSFYKYELHRATHPDVYLVEKVLHRKGDKVYVKWLGFDGSHNSWIHKNNVI
ncbi:PREDICTED: uncharacterized protein LOC105145010 [Acromyrmex echinatior]|uniref:uncharacterized protein LOC105145010 n=1 Tax=Acromyrmex echinatior TaxID=103372 RepID=UPI000580FAD4|nr:PREDICTED: uncharacterized protein LOC105145010 [Acromyrmex echinatior]